MNATLTPRTRKALCHFAYEAWMLKETGRVIFDHWDQLDRITANAMIESHAIHVRNLIYFLFDRSDGAEIRARDFVAGWTEKRSDDLIKRAEGRVGAEIAHLTYARLDVRGKSKQWDPELDALIHAALGRWLAQAPEEVRRIVLDYPSEECRLLAEADQ